MTTPQDTAYKIPPRRWYNLEQAKKRIYQLTGEEITTADLIHHWKNHKLDLKICVRYEFENNLLSILNKNEELQMINLIQFEINEIINCNFSGVYNDGLCYILSFSKDHRFTIEHNSTLEMLYNKKTKSDKNSDEIQVDFNELNNKNLESNNNDREIQLKFNKYGFFIGALQGLVSIEPRIDTNYTFFFNFFPSSVLSLAEISNLFVDDDNDEFIYIDFVPDEITEFKDCNLFITAEEIERFLQGTSIAKKAQKAKENKTGSKTLNAQAEFIQNLLSIHYGEEVANNPRKFLDNPRSEIIKDFETKGLKPPAGETVKRWLKA